MVRLAETLPFFADRRVILIENSGFMKNACDDMAERAALCVREYCGVYLLGEIGPCKDQSAARSSECLMCSCCYMKKYYKVPKVKPGK